MNVLIFTPDIEGHHLEYIHHIYLLASKSRNNTYIFLLPSKFSEIKQNFTWTEENNISFDLYDNNLFPVDLDSTMAVLKNAYRITKYVAYKVKYYSADVVYSNYLILFVPFAPLLFKKTTKIVGIVYKIYLNEDNYQSSRTSLIERYKFKMMAKSKVFRSVYLLNDEKSSFELNKLYQTNKFKPIPDPFVPLQHNTLINIREKYNIPIDNTLFAHFGSMNVNKGTLEILESLKLLSKKECDHYSFFFAGKIAEGIRTDFYKQYSEIKNRLQIILIDDFCSYEFLASLCTACDCILTPYKRTAQSSGLIGYASQYGKPVIAPNRGLLGYLINKYGLGILIDEINTVNLREAYQKISSGLFVSPDDSYCRDNNIKSFQNVLKIDIA